jgi:hypothetical protein
MRLTILLLIAALAVAGESAPEQPAIAVTLMGYRTLGADGRPQGVVVAIDRAALEALDPQPALPDLPAVLVGAPRIAVTLRAGADAADALIELPAAVPGRHGAELVLPLPGAIAACELGRGRPAAWRVEEDGLRIALPAGWRGLVRIAAVLPVNVSGGDRRAVLAVAGGVGGSLTVGAVAPWLAQPGLPSDLPLSGGRLELAWTLPGGEAVAQHRLTVQQQVRLQLAPGRIAWEAAISLSSAGAGLTGIRLELPAELAVEAVEDRDGAAWSLEAGAVRLQWAEPGADRQVRLRGALPRSAAGGDLDALVGLPGAARSTGRLALVGGPGVRFLRPLHPAIASTEPAEGEDLAVRWDEPPAALRLRWEPIPVELAVERDLAVVLGAGVVRAAALVRVAGRGETGQLALELPEPWRLVQATGAGRQAIDAQGTRNVVLSAARPWRPGDQIVLRLEAERGLFDRAPVLPLLAPQGLAAGRFRLAIGDSADRLRVEAGALRAIAPETVAASLPLALAAGEGWRAAWELAGDARPVAAVAAEAPRASAVLSHYLILGRDGVRWSLRLALQPERGAHEGLDLALPAGVRLVAVGGPGLGGWNLSDGRLRLRWAAPATATIAVDLELDAPAGADGGVALAAPRIAGIEAAQQIALVEDDDLGLVTRTPDGLAELAQPIAALPAGVERARVRWLWRAARPDWSLALGREALAVGGGADGLATLVDGGATVGEDGELRGVATWHVINRSRQQLPLDIPAGVELWEARVDGALVRARRDTDGRTWLPVEPLRPGQASTRVQLAWRAAPQPGGAIALTAPRLAGLRIVASAWRLAAPPGWGLERRGGSLEAADAVEVAALRAQAVIDEIQRLQAVDGLAEAGLRRLDGQLARLDAELKDHLAALGEADRLLRGSRSASSAWASKLGSTSQAIAGNRQQILEIQQGIQRAYGSRSARRKGLNIDALNQRWDANQAEAAGETARQLPIEQPWSTPLALAPGAGLGAGEAPTGQTGAAAQAIAGIEPAAEPAQPTLVLRGQGDGLDAALRLVPPPHPRGPWILVGLGLLAGAGAWLALRRIRGRCVR